MCLPEYAAFRLPLRHTSMFPVFPLAISANNGRALVYGRDIAKWNIAFGGAWRGNNTKYCFFLLGSESYLNYVTNYIYIYI